VIDINTKIDLNVALQVGAATETVTVQGGAGVTLNTDDASGGTIMDPDKVQQLPLNGRQAYMLLSLTPGAQFTQTQFGSSGYSGPRGWDESNAYSINGQSGSYNQFSLDGAPVSQQNGGGSGTWNISPNIDAIQEFKVMTNTYDAQYGRYAGGSVNTILKSGTRQFHGTVFDFWRNSVLDANTYTLNQQNEAKPFHLEKQSLLLRKLPGLARGHAGRHGRQCAYGGHVPRCFWQRQPAGLSGRQGGRSTL
jgi:hypothetical protein